MGEQIKKNVAVEPKVPSHQPCMHGYNVDDIKNWNEKNDKNAKYFRSRVPLSERIPAFAATQANPKLSPEPQVMNLSADYDKEKTSYRYDDTFTRNLLKFWQYTDIYGAWHGMQVEGSDPDKPDFGVINLPNPAYTDAAHRNGVLSLGCWFWPREGQTFSDWVEQSPDGSFLVADKLIEMAEYFGFDGYFINQEASISSEDALKLLEMFKYMRKKAPNDFYLQWYDTVLLDGNLRYQNQFNENNVPWIIDNEEPVMNSMFINYAWNKSRLHSSNTYAKSLGLDPYKAVFASTENDKYGYNPPYDTRLIFPEDKAPRTGWALFGTDFVWNRYENKFDPDDQEEVFRRERRYWSGPNEDPTDKIGRTLYEPYPDPYHAVNPTEYRCWDGVAHYIPARSVIGTFPFVTRFNTGHGRSFFLNGEVVSTTEWYNAGIQDILPSWQWWVKSSGSEPSLTPSFDYTTAYNGGSSLKVSGTLSPANPTELRLFKTKLEVSADKKVTITYKSAAANTSATMKLGVIFEDDPDNFVWLEMGSIVSDDWNKKVFNLNEFSGRIIATIGLQFVSTTKTDVSFHIGELSFTSETSVTPKTPSAFKIEKAYKDLDANTAELFLSWNFQSKDIWYYDIARIDPHGNREVIGRIYDEVYYIKSLNRIDGEETSTLELTAVNFEGVCSKPVTTLFKW